MQHSKLVCKRGTIYSISTDVMSNVSYGSSRCMLWEPLLSSCYQFRASVIYQYVIVYPVRVLGLSLESETQELVAVCFGTKRTCSSSRMGICNSSAYVSE